MIRLLLILSLIATPCYSASTISSWNESTGVVQGSGTAFVSGLESNIIKVDNFEAGTDGVRIAGGSYGECYNCWTDYVAVAAQGTDNPRYSTENNKTGSTLNAKFVYGSTTASYSDSLLMWTPTQGTKYTDKLFMSGWVRWTWGTTTDITHQHKYFSVSMGDPSVDGGILTAYPTVTAIAWYQKTGAGGNNVYESNILPCTTSYGCDQSVPDELKDGGVGYDPFGEEIWSQFQMWVKGGETDGEVHIRMYNPTADTVVAFDLTDHLTLIPDTDHFWGRFNWGRTHANVDGTTFDGTYYYDDLYHAEGWGRVVVQNKINFADGTYSILQEPETSSTSQIDTKVNQGIIPDEVVAYLFVIDSDGIPSDQDAVTPGYQGFPITFSGAPNPNTVGVSINYNGIRVE